VASGHWGETGFAHTDLDQQLRQHGIEHIILAGLTAPGCVEGTGRWALELGYSVTLAKDATAAFTREWEATTPTCTIGSSQRRRAWSCPHVIARGRRAPLAMTEPWECRLPDHAWLSAAGPRGYGLAGGCGPLLQV